MGSAVINLERSEEMIRVVGKRGKGSFESQLDDAAKGKEFVRIDCTS